MLINNNISNCGANHSEIKGTAKKDDNIYKSWNVYYLMYHYIPKISNHSVRVTVQVDELLLNMKLVDWTCMLARSSVYSTTAEIIKIQASHPEDFSQENKIK